MNGICSISVSPQCDAWSVECQLPVSQTCSQPLHVAVLDSPSPQLTLSSQKEGPESRNTGLKSSESNGSVLSVYTNRGG